MSKVDERDLEVAKSAVENLIDVAPDADGIIRNVSIEALVQEYRDLRDELSVRRKEFETFESETKHRMEQISMTLREIADKLGLNALPTNAGTAYRTIKEYFRVGSWDHVLTWIKETGNFQCLEKRVGKLAVKEIYDSTGELPPGIEYSMEVEFVVRKNTK